MTDKDGGMMTRARRNRSQSREVSNGAAPVAGKSGGRAAVTNLETVAEVLHLPSTPVNASQKSHRSESSMSLGLNGPQASGGSRTASPINLSRAQEKEELQGLNDRLAKVLNRLNDLEAENRSLKVKKKLFNFFKKKFGIFFQKNFFFEKKIFFFVLFCRST